MVKAPWVEIFGKPLLQLQPRPVKPHIGRRFGNPKDFGHVCERHFLEVIQHDNFPDRPWQASHRRADCFSRGRRINRRCLIRTRRASLKQRLQRLQAHRTPPMDAAAYVDHDPRQPGVKAAFAQKSAAMEVRVHESFLQGILGVRGIPAEKTRRHFPESRAVQRDDPLERGVITGSKPAGECDLRISGGCGVGRFCHACRFPHHELFPRALLIGCGPAAQSYIQADLRRLNYNVWMDDQQTYLLNGLVTRQYGVGRIVRFRQVERGRQAATYELLTSRRNEYMVYLYPAAFTPEQLEFTARTINTLDENRFSVVPMLKRSPDADSEFVGEGPQGTRMLVSIGTAGSPLP